jgi:aryl-alcohol dehydrogenase-like predicted oxidoreductase
MEALLSLQQSGKIRAAGVSNYSLEQMKEASKVLKLVSNQLPYSMVRRDIEADLLPWCMDKGCSVLAYSPLQRGLLTGKFRQRRDFAQGDSRPFTPYYREENIARTNAFLDELRPLAADKGVSLAQLVLRWTMDRPGITVVLAGARNEEQLKHNALALELRLSEEERMFIDHRLEDLVLLLD